MEKVEYVEKACGSVDGISFAENVNVLAKSEFLDSYNDDRQLHLPHAPEEKIKITDNVADARHYSKKLYAG